MKKIVVVSDSHGTIVKLAKILDFERPFDCLVHCGDGVGDLFHVDLEDGTTVVRVSGNVDIARGSDCDRVTFFEVAGARVMVAHGDQFRVHHDYSWILREGREKNADVVLFGHTHIRYRGEGMPILFNPGPASGGHYGIITIGKGLLFEHRKLDT